MSYEMKTDEIPREDLIEMPDGTVKHFTGAERDALDQLTYALVEEATKIGSNVEWSKVSGGHKKKLRTATVRLLAYFQSNSAGVLKASGSAPLSTED